MDDKDISPGHGGSSYDDKTVTPPPEKGGAEILEHASQGRRHSVALNIVQNPLQVHSTRKPSQFPHYSPVL
jgi:hypothetical protein